MTVGFLSPSEFAMACRKGEVPASVMAALATKSELVKVLHLVGALEPLSLTRPGACEVVQDFRRTIEVPPATEEVDEDGNVTFRPGRALATTLCPSGNGAMVVDKLRLKPANLTAELSGKVQVRVNPLTIFDKNCLAFGAKEEDCGAFFNIEHLVLCPKTGVEVFALNCNLCSPALFTVKARIWETC